MTSKIIKVKDWSELPEILKPGTYYIDGVKVTVRKPVEKEEVMMFTHGVKKLADKYYG